MFNQDRMHGWKQGDGFLAGQESRDCFDFISDVVIYGIYLSLALGRGVHIVLSHLTFISMKVSN